MLLQLQSSSSHLSGWCELASWGNITETAIERETAESDDDDGDEEDASADDDDDDDSDGASRDGHDGTRW